VTQLSFAPHDTADVALNRFLLVISEIYGKEKDFKIALFRALRESLGGFCEDTTTESRADWATTSHHAGTRGANLSTVTGDLEAQLMRPAEGELIRLKSCDVGFATEVSRSQDLKFPSGYSITKSTNHLACVVFGQDAWDVTATVDLKLSHSACMEFNCYDQDPDLSVKHSPLAHALSHAMDVWLCLARRGYRKEPPALPAVVLAARKDKDGYEQRLCCMEAFLDMPTCLGGWFMYTIDRCVAFPRENNGAEAMAAYMQALTVFIKTLRIGLTNAKTIQQNMEQNKDDAVSLWCSPPREDMELLASPIPFSKKSARGLTIAQGELHKFTGKRMAVDEWIKGIETRRALVFDSSPASLEDCIIKVSCNTVHTTLVPATNSWDALECISSEGTKRLNDELSKVILACAHPSKRCLVL
jgi:hypothetical protein